MNQTTGFIGDHGFNFQISSSIPDGAHKVYVYAIDSAGGTKRLLSGSPASIQLVRNQSPSQGQTLVGVPIFGAMLQVKWTRGSFSAWRNSSTGAVDIWSITNGKVSGENQNVGNVSSTWQFAGIGDYNGDGTDDMAGRNSLTGEVDTWLISGAKINGGGSIGTASSAWQALANSPVYLPGQ